MLCPFLVRGRRFGRVGAALVLLLGAGSAKAPAAVASASALDVRLHYSLSFELPDTRGARGERAPSWVVELSAHDLAPERGAIRLDLDDWGSWREVDSFYLEVLESEPPLAASSAGPWELRTPSDWTGELRVVYRIRPTRLGSRAQKRWGLLPFWTDSYSYGNSRNVFMSVRQAGERLVAKRTLELRAPDELAIFTGWAGLASGTQELEVDPCDGNALIAFGLPQAHERFERAAAPVVVAQFGSAAKVAAEVGQVVVTLVEAMGDALAYPRETPLFVFVTDAGGGGMGAEHGFVVGFEATSPASHAQSPYFRHLVAHELFHDWLGITVDANESIVWFHEGFTDYLALWHLASSELVPRTWFAERLLELEADALRQSALGTVAFAEAGVGWRDGDGPLETMAYKGGALLAFALDVELRQGGHPGLHELIRDLLRSEEQAVELEFLRTWLDERDLAGFYAQAIAGTALPPVIEGLSRVGFELEQVSESLTWLGVRAEGEGLGARIAEVDPDGPGARAGVRVGDVVTGYFPNRSRPPELAPELATELRFGLTLFQPEAEEFKIWVQRDTENIELALEPTRIPGGYRLEVRAQDSALDRFFAAP